METEKKVFTVDPTNTSPEQLKDLIAATVLEAKEKSKKASKETPKKSIPVAINAKDYGFLKKNRYDEERDKWPITFTLQHKRHPEKIVELRACNFCHACHMIHWKVNQVRLIEQKCDQSPDIVDNIHAMKMESVGIQVSSTAVV